MTIESHGTIYFLLSDTPNRKEIFDKRVSTFEVHSKKIGDAAIDLAKAGGVMDKKTVDDIIRTSEKVECYEQ